MQYFGSIIVEGVAESWVEAEMSWVEVDGAGWRWVHSLVIPLLKCDSNTDALPAILKFLRTTKETRVVEAVFCIVIGGWIGQLELF